MPNTLNSESSPLTGLRVLNTRPAERNAELTQALQQAGAEVINLPLLTLQALALSAEDKAKVMDLDRYTWVFVVSPTAAEIGLRLLSDYWPQWPVAVQWLAVGATTAACLEREGIQPIVPEQETSEGILQLPQLADLPAQARCLVIRGEGGRNLVRDSLGSLGVQVDYLNVYARALPAEAPQQWQQQAVLPDVVIITSGEILQYWLTLAGEVGRQIPCIVISSRLAALAQQAGCVDVIVATSTRSTDIVNALNAWRAGINRVIA